MQSSNFLQICCTRSRLFSLQAHSKLQNLEDMQIRSFHGPIQIAAEENLIAVQIGQAAPEIADASTKQLERLEDAKRRSEVAKKQFGKFRDVCISAQQVNSPLASAANYCHSFIICLQYSL